MPPKPGEKRSHLRGSFVLTEPIPFVGVETGMHAAAGFKDHVRFIDLEVCKKCSIKVCIEMCSGQAIRPGNDGVPSFDREKCIHY